MNDESPRSCSTPESRSQGARLSPVGLLSLATAVPRYAIEQRDVEAMAAELFVSRPALFERLRPAYVNAGVDRRFSCVPLAWYLEPHGWADRNRLYIEHAVALLMQAAEGSLERAGLGARDIDALVVASTTGIATPSLDALLMERLSFRRDVARLPIFGLGCAGGVLGLARAAALARAMPGARVLFLVVELCGLTLRQGDLSKSNIIATALFGDGAAAAVVQAGCGFLAGPPVITGWAEHTWPRSLDVMGWTVADDGLGVLFSRDIPAIVRARMRAAAEGALAAQDLAWSDIDGFVCHPGGAKVIAALEEAFGLARGALAGAREVLRGYGNMSAASVLFVLERALAEHRGGRKRYLMSTLGPGFTAGFMTLEVP